MKKILLTLSLLSSLAIQANVIVKDFGQSYTGSVKKIETPETLEELSQLVATTQDTIAIAGGKYSMGGQTWSQNGIVVDMKNINKIISFDPKEKMITVQAGIRWSEIQEYIDAHNLSIITMQSYNNFSVGGSLSVNVHGRDIHYGPLIETIESIKVLLADGSLKAASRTENHDLFRAAIGGYGACGIIVEATLHLTENCALERSVRRMPLSEYKKFFYEHIQNNPEVILHNTDLYTHNFNEVSSVTWYKSSKPLTVQDRLQQTTYYSISKEKIAEFAIRRIPGCKTLRPPLDKYFVYSSDSVVWRNYEMSYKVESLAMMANWVSTNILQEYFIPIDQLENFIKSLNIINKKHTGVNFINISIRYIPKNTESLLSYAQNECFSLVCYMNMVNTQIAPWLQEAFNQYTKKYTQEIILAALQTGGTYYLPYHLFGSQKQFEQAYPHFKEFKKIKNHYDPQGRFSNSLIKKYLS